MPILVAAELASETLRHTLPALNADNVKEVLEPVLTPDALLVSDVNRCHPPVAAALDISHESTNASAGERVRSALHTQTATSRHSQIKSFLRNFRDVATKCLDSYLKWFHLISDRVAEFLADGRVVSGAAGLIIAQGRMASMARSPASRSKNSVVDAFSVQSRLILPIPERAFFACLRTGQRECRIHDAICDLGGVVA